MPIEGVLVIGLEGGLLAYGGVFGLGGCPPVSAYIHKESGTLSLSAVNGIIANNVCVHVEANETLDKWVEAKDKERCGEALEEDGSIVDCNINDGGSSSDDVCHGIGRFPTTDNRYRDSADY